LKNSIDIEKIQYFKYKATTNLIVECVREFPITEEIKTYILTNDNLELEEIDGKLIVLI